MALGFGTNIPTNGLVFNFDPANHRSYSGSGSSVKNLLNKDQGTLINGPKYSNIRGGIISLNGINQLVSFPDAPYFRWNGSGVSYGGWIIYRDVYSSTKVIFSKGSNSQWYNAYSTFIFQGGITDIIGSNYLSFNQQLNYKWNHLFHTYDGVTSTLYLNGEILRARSLSPTNIEADSAPYTIGAETEAGSAGFYVILDVGPNKLYNRCLSSKEVKQIYIATKGRFDGYNGTTSLLINGNSTNDVSNHACSVNTYGNVAVTNAQQKYSGSAISFDGNGDYLMVADKSQMIFGLSDFTVEAFVKLNALPTSDAWPTNWSSHMMLATVGTYNLGDGLGFIIGQTKLIVHSSDSQIVSGTHGMTTNQWYHVAYCRKNGVIKLFVDGIEIGSASFTSAPTINSGANIYIGAETGQGAYLNGFIDGFRVIKDNGIYSSGFTSPSSQLGIIGD